MKNFLPKPTLVNRSELNQKFSSVYANGRKFGGFFGFAGILMVLFLCTGFTTNVKTFTRDKGTTKNKKIAEKKPVIFSDPAVGASVTFSCVSSSYIANSSTSSSSVSYTFTSPTDCDGIGFTAVDNTTGGGGTAGPRILVTSTHLLTFSRTSPATVTYGQLKSTSGAAFQLTGITIQTANVSNAQNITLSAYKGGVFVTGSNVVTAVPVQGTQAVINLSSSNFGSFYNNIDEIRVSTDNVAGNGLSITNITTASPVLPSTTITSLTKTGSSPTNASSVAYTATFAAAVTGLSTSDFSLTTSGVSGASVSSVSGSGTSWTVNVNTGSGDGSVVLKMSSSSGVSPSVSNVSFTGDTYAIDKTAPTVSSITATGTSPTNATSVGYTVTFAEAVTGVDGSDFTATTSGVSTTGIVVTPVSSSVYTVTVNGVSGTGSLRLDLKSSGTGIADLVGNAISGGFTSGGTYTIDQTAPTVSSITATGTSPTNGTSVGYTVTFAEAVTGVDGSDFTATTSGVSTTGIVVTPVSSSVYTVTVNGVSGTGSLRLDLKSSGTGIADLVGNAISGGFTSGGTYTIDQTAPTVSSITATGTSPTNGTSVGYTVTFAEAVTGVDGSDFTTTTSGVSTTGIVVTPVSSSVYTVTVNGVSGTGSLRLDLKSSGTGIADVAGNAITGGFTSGDSYSIDQTAPVVSSIAATGTSPTNATSVGYTVTFSKAVTGVDGSDFTATTSGVSTTGIVVTPVSSSVYTVTVNGVSGTGSLRLDLNGSGTGIADLVGNTISAGFTSGDTYSIDNTAPTLTSLIFSSGNANIAFAKNGDIVTLAFGANEAIQTPAVSIAGHIVTASNTGGNNYTASYTMTSGDSEGRIPFSLTVTDLAGNSGNYTDVAAGDDIEYDITSPTIAISAPSVSQIGAGGSGTVSYTVTYADANFNAGTLSTSAITLNSTGTATGTVGVSGSGTSYTVTISSISGAGTLGISIALGTASDLAGNTAPASGASGTFNVLSNDDNLTNLTISSGTLSPSFATGTLSYSVNVPYTVNSVTLTPTAEDINSTIDIGGNVISGNASGAQSLSVGANTINVTVTAQDGVTQNIYAVTVNRSPAAVDASLSNIQMSAGTLAPVFSPATTSYRVAVGNSFASITLMPTTTDPGATVKVNGTAVTSGSASPPIALKVGRDTITTTVKAQDGTTTKTYTVVVIRKANVNLISLKTDHSGLIPSFSPATTAYSTTVGLGTSSIVITPTVADLSDTIRVNGTQVASGSASPAIPLTIGANAVTILVKALDGTTKTYTLTVNRQADLDVINILLSHTKVTPVFSRTTTSYTATVGTGVTSTAETPILADATNTVTVNGVIVPSGTASGPITLAYGSNIITTLVTAADGTTRTYTVNVIRPTIANLKSLALSSGTLSPVFSPATTGYTASVDNAVSSITVTPVTAGSQATVTVNGTPVASGTASGNVDLSVGENAINIAVTGKDGILTKIYTVDVTRAAGSLNTVYQPISVSNPTDHPQMMGAEIAVHQGLSPNGDGINDFLLIDGITQYPDNKLQIMNRSGQLVYEAKGYDNSTKVFDGHSNKNGALQLPGTYFYSLDVTANGVTQHKTGFIVLKY